MEWYVWAVLSIGAIPAWFIIGALTERACRSIFDPTLAMFGERGESLEVLTWSGPLGLGAYLLLCVIVVLVVTVKINYRFVQWIRGANR